MKTIIQSILLLTISFYTHAQAIELSTYDEVSVSGGHTATLIQSHKNYAEVKMIKGDIENLEVYVNGDVLKIKTKKGLRIGTQTKAEVKVYYAQQLNEIDVSSGSRIESYDTIKSERFSIDASSGARCKIEVESKELDIDISSGARVTATGMSDAQTIDISSGASYNGKELKSEYAVVEASSGAKATVYCTKRIKAESSSGGSITYYGDPSDIQADASKWSGGSVKAGR